MYYVVATDRLDKEALYEIYVEVAKLDDLYKRFEGTAEKTSLNLGVALFGHISFVGEDENIVKNQANLVTKYTVYDHVIVVNSETQTYYCINPDANVEKD